jgi:hypothetical protein
VTNSAGFFTLVLPEQAVKAMITEAITKEAHMRIGNSFISLVITE